MHTSISFLVALLLSWSAFSCQENQAASQATSSRALPLPSAKGKEIAEAAMSLTKQRVVYHPSYFVIDYPNGDVPAHKGVCTDVVIRTLRKAGSDLQKEVHEDMRVHFQRYPKLWRATKPDRNIDHRRVPNLMTFFERKGMSQRITKQGSNYLPGDIVAWRLNNGLTHIGVVAHKLSDDGQRYLIVHNIGAGQVLEDCLFSFEIIGHYRL